MCMFLSPLVTGEYLDRYYAMLKEDSCHHPPATRRGLDDEHNNKLYVMLWPMVRLLVLESHAYRGPEDVIALSNSVIGSKSSCF